MVSLLNLGGFMKKGKPSFEEIRDDIIPECEKYYADLFDKFDDDEKYYELDFKEDLNIPVEFKSEGIVLPTARDMVDAFVDHIDISNARVFVNKKKNTQSAEEEAEIERKACLGLIHRTNVESDISPWRVAAKHYALHGLGVLKTVWDVDRWPDKPEQNEGESDDDYAERIDEWRSQTHVSIPIVIQAINPHCILPDPSFGGRMFVIEKQERTCFDAFKMWPHWKNPEGKGVTEKVTYYSFWDDTYRCDIVDSQPVLKIKGGVAKHKYGFIPYVLIDSGLGNISIEAKPEMRYVGMLRYIYDMLLAESRDFSLADIILAREAMKGGYITGRNAKSVNASDLTQKYGQYTPLPEDVEVHHWPTQVPPDMLNMHLARTNDYISSHAAPRSVRGLSEAGVRSGADRRLIMAEAGTRYQFSSESFKNGTSKVLTNCLLLLKNVIPGDVRVWARTPTDEFDIEIDRDKMKEPFTCYVEFSPISEQDEYTRKDSLMRQIQVGLITKKTARKQMSNIDPLDEELEEERQKIKDSPIVNQMVEQYLAGKLASELSKRQGAETIAGNVPTGTPGMGGQPMMGGTVPPISERAPIGSPEEMQQQLASMRSPNPLYPGQGMGGGGKRW